jgi:hypothetical protein
MYFEKLRQADVMLAIMSPAFFESRPCFEEQVEARRHGLKVIPLLFQLEENGKPPGAVEGGGAAWIEAYGNKDGEDKRVAHETLCAFRVPGYNVDHLKLNSEPAPPNTMLENDLLDKLVGRVKKMLNDSETAGGLKEQLAEKDAELAKRDVELAERTAELAERDAMLAEKDAERDVELAERDAMLAEKDAMIARLMRASGGDQVAQVRGAELEGTVSPAPDVGAGAGGGIGGVEEPDGALSGPYQAPVLRRANTH